MADERIRQRREEGNPGVRRWFALGALVVSLAATAADGPYDEHADAKAQIRQALAAATATGTPVIVVFGANWCGDCRMLDKAMKEGASAPLIAREFKVVKVDVGKFDRNVDVAESYGVPLKKGIPAVVVLSARNEVLHATRGGELADARKMGDNGVYEYFKGVSAGTRPRS
jgi:protein disulfide-isomerase